MFLKALGHVEKFVIDREVKKNQIKAYNEKKKILLDYFISPSIDSQEHLVYEKLPNLKEEILLSVQIKGIKKSIKAVRVGPEEYLVVIAGEKITLTPKDCEFRYWKYINYECR